MTEIDWESMWEDDIKGRKKKKKETTGDYHLQSPIRSDSRYYLGHKLGIRDDFIYKYDRTFHKYPMFIQLLGDSLLKKLLIDENSSPNIVLSSESLYGDLLSLVYESCGWTSSWTTESIKLINITIEQFIESMDPLYTTELKVPHNDKHINRIWSLKNYLEDIKLNIIKLGKVQSNEWLTMPSNMIWNKKGDILISRSFLILPDKKNQGDSITNWRQYPTDTYYLLDYEQLLGISDTITSRALTIAYLKSIPSRLSYMPSSDHLISLYKIYDQLFSQYKNDTYLFVKHFESICYCVLMEKTDKIGLYNSFKCNILNTTDIETNSINAKVYSLLMSLSEQQVSELQGVYRHWAHPTVDETAGCIKVKTYAHNRPTVKTDTMRRIVGCLKRQFCYSFIEKHGRWPKCDATKLPVGSLLRRCVENQIRSFISYGDQIPLLEWDMLRIYNELVFDYHFDFTDLIDDKSISVSSDYLQFLYDPNITNQKYPDLSKMTSRRLLCEVLKRSEIIIEEICDLLRKDMFPASLYNILLSSKEREIKIDPRLFAMMPLELRLYFCVTEINISKKVFPYYPQTSMTMDEKALTNRLYHMSKNKNLTGVAIVLVSIDFKSWNLHWSQYSTYSAFKMLDDLFNIPGLYSRSHHIFSKCLVTLMSRLNPPDKYKILDDTSVNPTSHNVNDNTWQDHRGGFEGIRQKGWTFITIGILLLVESITGIKSMIIGQGDNQVCRLEFPFNTEKYANSEVYIEAEKNYLKSRVSEFLSVLDLVVKDIGLEVKLSETSSSEGTMMYSKEIIINGGYQSQSIKRISRTLPDTNQIHPIIHAKVSTLQTAGLSATQKTFHIWACFYITQLETLCLIKRDGENAMRKQFNSAEYKVSQYRSKLSYKRVMDILSTEDFYKMILMSCGDIMGLPMSNPLNYMYRGHPDPLTGYLECLYICSDPMSKKILNFLISDKLPLGNGNLSLLYSNPNAVNVKCENPILSIFKRQMEKSLEEGTRNVHLRQIFNSQFKEFEDKIIEYFSTCTPQYPKVFHEAIQTLVIRTRDTFISKFYNSNTLLQLNVKSENDGNILSELDKSDIKLINDLVLKYCIITQFSGIFLEDICSTQLADLLRNKTWSLSLRGKKIEGVTVPHPSHQFKKVEDIDEAELKNIEYISLIAPSGVNKTSLYQIGPQTPFVGAKTHEKKSGRLMVVPTANRPLQAAMRLHQISTWCFSEFSTLSEFTQRGISSRTNLDPNIVALSGGSIYSGSVAHRMNDHCSPKTTLNNMRGNITTHALISTDTMGVYSRGSDNYNIHFQGAIHMMLRDFSNRVLRSEEDILTCYMMFKLNCKKCLIKYSEEKIHTDAVCPSIPILYDNPLVYSNIETDEIYELPKSDLIKIRRHDRSDVAVAACLLQKMVKGSESQIMTGSESNAPIISTFSLQDLSKIGIQAVIQSLALMLILKFEYAANDMLNSIDNLPRECWGAFPEYCLSPELYKELMKLLFVDGISDIHSKPHVILNKLNGLLVRQIKYLLQNIDVLRESIFKLVYFHNDGISINIILRMWSYSNYILGFQSLNTHYIICRAIAKNAKSYMVSKNIFDEIGRILIYKSDTKLGSILTHNPIYLSPLPIESYLRSGIFLQNDNSIQDKNNRYFVKRNYHLDINLSDNYPLCKTLKPINDDLIILERKSVTDLSIKVSKSIQFADIRLRDDHKYRLANNLSCAYLKYAEILIREKIALNHPVLCTADGEGSVSYLCYQLSNCTVYYNSLCDRNNLQPHRYEGYTPGSFLQNPEGILGSHLCMRTGGDLTDNYYIQQLLSILPDQLSLLTMDAEVAGKFNPGTALRILSNIQKLLITKDCSSVIYKTFMDKSDLVYYIINALSVIFVNIKLIVPTYSSYEGSEIFVVGNSRRTVAIDKNIINLKENALYLSKHDSSIQVLLESVDRNLSDNPFQDSRRNTTRDLLTLGKCLGFKCNYPHSLSRYLLDNSILSHKDSISTDIRCVVRNHLELIKDFLISRGNALTGSKSSGRTSLASYGKISTHSIIDRSSKAIINAMILWHTRAITGNGSEVVRKIREMLDMQLYISLSDLKDPTKFISNNFEEKISNLIDRFQGVKKDEIIYEYKYKDLRTWMVEFAKYFWKIVGHLTYIDLCTYSQQINE